MDEGKFEARKKREGRRKEKGREVQFGKLSYLLNSTILIL